MDKSKSKDINLSTLLKDNYIELDLKEKDKTKLIAELLNLISNSNQIRNKKVLLNALIEREKLGSTAIGNGVAIPHAKIDGFKNIMFVFGRSIEGIDFNSLDGEKTYIFFMVISSKKDVGNHLKILAKISYIVKDKFTVELLKKAKDKDRIRKIISDSERHIP